MKKTKEQIDSLVESGKKTRFSSTNQPENRGRKGKAVSQFLREIGEAQKLSYTIRVTKKTGTGADKEVEKHVENVSIGGNTSNLNELLAMRLFGAALNGDKKALRELLDRMEGRPKQNFGFEPGDGDDDTEITVTIKKSRSDGEPDDENDDD